MAKRVRRRKHKTNFAAILVTTGALLVLGACAYALPPPFMSSKPQIESQTTIETQEIDTSISPEVGPGREFGIAAGGNLTSLTARELDAYIAGLKELGVQWVRYDINWNIVQQRDSAHENWGSHDRVVDAMSKAGLKSLAIILYTPEWARAPECKDSSLCRPADPQKYAEFSAMAVKRYASKGVDAWQIWNEQNWYTFWKPLPNAEHYARLLIAASKAMKAEDPDATIIVGGLGGTRARNGNIEPRTFMERLYKAGAKNAFDAVGVHPYSFPRSPADAESSWKFTSDVHKVMSRYGDGAKKVWVTEYGAPTGGGKTIATKPNSTQVSGTPVTEDVQKIILNAAIDQLKGREWLGPFFWYSYRDLGKDPNDRESFFGLLRHDGSKKPAFDAYKKAVQENSGQ